MDEKIIGTVQYFAGSYCPPSYLPLEGQTLDLNDYPIFQAFVFGHLFDHPQSRRLVLIPDWRPRDAEGNIRPWQKGELRPYICYRGLFPQRAED